MSDIDSVPDAPSGPPAQEPLPACIGTAYMRDDGTIELQLRAESPDGMVGEALITYAPDDLQYQGILKHLGSMKPGDHVSVPPFSA